MGAGTAAAMLGDALLNVAAVLAAVLNTVPDALAALRIITIAGMTNRLVGSLPLATVAGARCMNSEWSMGRAEI